ncbi:MAG: hypothetical protein ACLU45_01845 [Dialister invisus]|uniref:hypothetical protein n=1 Tax=Dialister invisus TaxID=218538 RepID=UPI0039998C53
MIILTKKKFCFELDGEQFTSRGGMEMENAPSWIQKTWLFDLAVKMETSSLRRIATQKQRRM